MKAKKEIERNSVKYYLLKKYVDFCFRLFYKVRYINKEKVNTREGSIFACNHQNALMDALAILTSFTWQPVFLARADIFRNKTIARVLRFLKILPVYRIRDGYDQLSNNQQVFDQTFKVLKNGTPIAMFPEGNHVGIKNVRILKKGLARIAFSYRHETSEINDIKIIPVGLNYDSYHESGSHLYIQFGEPIRISAYDNEYAENPAKATNSFLQDLRSSLQLNSLHIENEEVSPVADLVIKLYGVHAKVQKVKPQEILQKQKDIIFELETEFAENPEEFKRLSYHADSFNKQLKHYKINPDHLQILFIKNKTLRIFLQSALLIITLPLYVYSLINNLIPVGLIKRITRLIKDPQFKSSVFFVGSILTFPFIHLIQALVLSIIISSWKWGLIYLLSLPVSFWFKLKWERIWCNYVSGIRVRNNLTKIKVHFLAIKEFYSL
ncbi:MAG: 1-acyl-sn-glycerol-3-phosphate acyltransferase [Bacteroidales bacterium]|nr:1-acyl-sn-glycerol-3-phosphate acyltransferase [Bacteroidales bacterium]